MFPSSMSPCRYGGSRDRAVIFSLSLRFRWASEPLRPFMPYVSPWSAHKILLVRAPQLGRIWSSQGRLMRQLFVDAARGMDEQMAGKRRPDAVRYVLAVETGELDAKIT